MRRWLRARRGKPTLVDRRAALREQAEAEAAGDYSPEEHAAMEAYLAEPDEDDDDEWSSFALVRPPRGEKQVVALIGAYDDEPRGQNPNCRPGVQAYLKFLEIQVRGTPGMPVENPEPFKPVEAVELVDGTAPAPKLEKPKRKRRRVKLEPALDRDSANLARFARKLKGET